MDFGSERGLYRCTINLCLLDQSERGLYLMPNSRLCSLSMCLNCSPVLHVAFDVVYSMPSGSMRI